jgi:hypothetical protein
MTLHFSHIGLTLGRTFIASLAVTENDATPGEVVGSDFNLDTITRKDPDAMHAHLPGGMSEHVVPVLELYLEHRVRQRLHDGAFERDALFLGF